MTEPLISGHEVTGVDGNVRAGLFSKQTVLSQPTTQELAPPPPVGAWQPLASAGQGAAAVVWRARHVRTGCVGALKIARGPDAILALAREAAVLARVARRWGPALVDAGHGFIVTEWVEGEPVGRATERSHRIETAAIVAHGVARALEELHEAGVHHGDVTPSNILLAPRRPRCDTPTDRGATLIDLSLAGAPGVAFGGTPRYAAPELRERGEAGPAADLWALGVVLAEILDPRAAAADPRDAVAPFRCEEESEPARWVLSLVAAAPGGRPAAAWLARRAARWLGLAIDEDEAVRTRVERVRRAYLRERSRDIAPRAIVSPDIEQPARAWLEDAVAWASKLAPEAESAPQLAAEPSSRVVEPLTAVRRARWLVALTGPSAAAWPVPSEGQGEGDMTARAVALARTRDPAAWTREDFVGTRDVAPPGWSEIVPSGDPLDRALRLMRELTRPSPSPAALAAAEDDVARSTAPLALVLQLASALARAGETGRAWAALLSAHGPEADALRGELARRRGDLDEACACATRAATGPAPAQWIARATLARLAWDRGDLDGADVCLEGARGPAAAEMRALVAWRRGAHDAGLPIVEQALLETMDIEVSARLEGVRGLLEMGRGASGAALDGFGRAVELATRAGAVVEEATYLTSEAAAAVDMGLLGRALAAATRAALLWERLGRPARAARAWLARAAALSTIGALHAADDAAEEARARAEEAGDAEAAAFARWAQVEVRPPGDPQARSWAIEAADGLLGSHIESRLRATARLIVWAPDAVDAREGPRWDEVASSASGPARWEWWGARALACLAAAPAPGDERVVGALTGLADLPAPLGSKGPALEAAQRLATRLGNGEAARRFDFARSQAARALLEGTPPELRASFASVTWTRTAGIEGVMSDAAFAPAQVAQLESIVRSLSGRDRLRPLLEQVLDTLVLWTGVERGLLLLRAPDGRLVPRAARNLARDDIGGEQLALSQTIARRAIESGDAVVATDALSTLGDLHASVHALRLRSVLAVPLQARGETLGVVYLDDRIRRGAFGPRELAWVRVVASQAAMAVADARDSVLLRRAARRAERARHRVETMLREKEAELDVTKTELEIVRENGGTRHRYHEIAGRSEPMRSLLRLVDRVAASDVPVLIVGESGTGKELVARAVHAHGARAGRPFVSENCASVPETLLESTLFGHVRGAFTGASSTRAGLFDIADRGTLFLDEIGEMSLAMQAKLLRVLQEGEVRAVGGERVRKVDVRVIGATHRDLSAMVASGEFREDLFYRLNVIALCVPPLRERSEDIPVLVEHFVGKHRPGGSVKVTRAAMAKLVAFPWPGNVRQLENEIRRALVLSDGAIDLQDLSADVLRGGTNASRGSGLDLRSRVDALETELVLEAMAKTRGNQTRAAQLLGLSRFGLQKMMKRLGVKPSP
ncbi:MAG: sigma 54-interacting transcriptional regulator [Polyangiaceae bacterium]|jgi:transcriptional regulator with GAF, ATPase, and Fis domain/tetratricopeptide (TPR) repeat protein